MRDLASSRVYGGRCVSGSKVKALGVSSGANLAEDDFAMLLQESRDANVRAAIAALLGADSTKDELAV